MRIFASGRQLLAAPIIAVLLLSSGDVSRALAAEDFRACLMREADQLFGRLALAIGASEIDPATINDGFITAQSEAIPETCAATAGQSTPADIAAFRAYLARWSYHLDRKLAEITAKGAAD